jgi:hypothetical protein
MQKWTEMEVVWIQQAVQTVDPLAEIAVATTPGKLLLITSPSPYW